MEKSERQNNFNMLRMLAALLVFFSHSFSVYGYEEKHLLSDSNALLGINYATLGCDIFFVVSGFLVTQSFLNAKRLDRFFLNRAVRIYPALLVNMIITFYVFIFIINIYPVDKFYSLLPNEIPEYMQRITFFGQYDVLKNFHNLSIWTLPYEILCYLVLGILCTIINAKKIIPIFTILYASVFYEKIFLPDGGLFSFINLAYLHCMSFCIGSCFAVYRDILPLKKSIAVVAYIALFAQIINDIHFYPVYLFSVAYLTIYTAIGVKPFWKIFSKNDLSYGIYIYAAPIQQIFVLFFNAHILKFGFIAYVIISLIYTLFFAALSWNIIEKPALKLKKLWAIKPSSALQSQ